MADWVYDYTFAPNTAAASAQVNANFATARAKILAAQAGVDAVAVISDTAANIVNYAPSPATAGKRHFRASDTGAVYLDIGTAWAQLTGGLTPTAHAATHKAGGTDALFAFGSWSAETDGDGHFTASTTWGTLHAVPQVSWAFFTGDPGGAGKVYVTAVSATGASVEGFNNGPLGTGVAGVVVALL